MKKFIRSILKNFIREAEMFGYFLIELILLPFKTLKKIFEILFESCHSEDRMVSKIVREYDKVFAEDEKFLEHRYKKIKNLNNVLTKKRKNRTEKKIKNMLDEAKWVL